MAEEMTTATATAETGATAQATETGNETKAQENNVQETLSTEAIEKLIQSRVDKSNAELGKKIAELQKENANLKKKNMTDEEVRNLEIADKEKALTEKEQALLERENRLYAIKAIKEIGLDDGSQQSLDLVDFVMGKDEETITAKVKSFKALVDRFVTSKVDQTFKEKGRVPNGSNSNGNKEETNDKNNIAIQLGQKAAETAKKSNTILDYYYGGKK